MEREGPYAVTPIGNTWKGKHPGAMEGAGSGGGEAGKRPFWSGRVENLDKKEAKWQGWLHCWFHLVGY